jgi:O-antigen/teichoic acid export membrane protein
MKDFIIKWLRKTEKYLQVDIIYLVKNSLWLNSNTVVVGVMSFVVSIAFARYVSKDVYGIYQFILSFGAIIGGTTLVGMNSAVTQAVARGFDGVFRRSIKEQLKFALIPLSIGLIISAYYGLSHNPTISISLAIIAILIPIGNAFNTWSAYLSGKQDFKYLFIFSQIINITYYGGIIICIFVIPSTIPLILANFLLNTIANIIVYILVIRKYTPNTKNDPSAIVYGKKLSLSNLLPMITGNIDNLIIFHFLGATQLALYAFASNIPEKLGGFLKPISSIAFPKLSIKEPDEVASIISSKTYHLFIVTCIGGLLYIFLAPLLFKVFFPAYIASIRYSQIYTIAMIASVVTGLPMTALYATRSKYTYYINIWYPLYSILFICAGAYLYGIWGVIIAKIISNMLLLIHTHYYAKIHR